MININNGNITLDDSCFTITKGLTKNEFINSNLFKDVLSQQTYTFSNYYLKPQLIGKDKFIVVLFFNQNSKIYLVNISISDDGSVPSWTNWSEYKELKRKDLHDKWLGENIGKPPYRYAWGEISSNYDPRSGSSMITIKYNL